MVAAWRPAQMVMAVVANHVYRTAVMIAQAFAARPMTAFMAPVMAPFMAPVMALIAPIVAQFVAIMPNLTTMMFYSVSIMPYILARLRACRLGRHGLRQGQGCSHSGTCKEHEAFHGDLLAWSGQRPVGGTG